MFPCDVHRDRVIDEFRHDNPFFLMRFTEFMIKVSEMVHSVQPPEVIVLRDEWDLQEIDMDRIHYRTFFEKFQLNQWRSGLRMSDLPDLEPACNKYKHYEYPVLQAFFMQVLVPKFYNLLALHWKYTSPHDVRPELDMDYLREIVVKLLGTVYGYSWPKSFYPKPEFCSICYEYIFVSKLTTRCGHIFHENCILPWLQDRSTCPFCRTILIT